MHCDKPQWPSQLLGCRILAYLKVTLDSDTPSLYKLYKPEQICAIVSKSPMFSWVGGVSYINRSAFCGCSGCVCVSYHIVGA